MNQSENVFKHKSHRKEHKTHILCLIQCVKVIIQKGGTDLDAVSECLELLFFACVILTFVYLLYYGVCCSIPKSVVVFKECSVLFVQ
jgi:hypothetical protein